MHNILLVILYLLGKCTNDCNCRISTINVAKKSRALYGRHRVYEIKTFNQIRASITNSFSAVCGRAECTYIALTLRTKPKSFANVSMRAKLDARRLHH